MAMDLAQWRAAQKQGETVELPSGLTVQVRKFGVLDLAMNGEIPEPLEPMVLAFMQGSQKIESVQQVADLGELIAITLGRALIGPDGLAVVELPASDRQFLFNWCNETPSFRSGQNGALGVAPGSNGVQPAAE